MGLSFVGAEDECVWSGGVHVTLDCPAQQAWAIFGDFGGLCKWNPAVTVCAIVEGESANEPGSVRYCQGDVADSWVRERLLVRDEANRFCQYRMEDNRFRFRDGIQGYVSQIQFHDVEGAKTFVDWTYTVHPVATQTYKEFTNFMTGFYLYNLNILQSAANIQSQEQSQKHSSICKVKSVQNLMAKALRS